MKRITHENYRKDTFYPRITRAVHELLASGPVITPIDVFKRMGLLSDEDVENWRFGRVPYLEKVIHCNLSAAGRILRILRMHADDRGLKPSETVYNKWGKGPRQRLRFSKFGILSVEAAYSRHFLSNRRRPGAGTEATATSCEPRGGEGGAKTSSSPAVEPGPPRSADGSGATGP